MIRPLLGLLAAGYLLWRWTGLQNRTTTNHLPLRRSVLRAVDTWEGEGGALPEQPAVPGQREHQKIPA